MRIVNYDQAFDLINITYTDKAKDIIKSLNKDGYNEQSICFSVWKSKDKLMKFRGDARFWNIFINEVKKYGFRKKV